MTNSINQKYTREADILGASIQAPKTNLITYEYWMNNVTCAYNNTFRKSESKRCLEYYFGGDSNFKSRGFLLSIPLLPLRLIPGKTYTSSIFITNHYYNTTLPYVNKFYKYRSDNSVESIIHNGHNDFSIVSNGLHFYTFEYNADVVSLLMCEGFDRSCPARDEYFELEILGLTEGTEPITRCSYDKSTNISVYSTNSEFVLGEGSITREMRRHIEQIERDIKKQENKYVINWR